VRGRAELGWEGRSGEGGGGGVEIGTNELAEAGGTDQKLDFGCDMSDRKEWRTQHLA
jgi:hypothetical protein